MRRIENEQARAKRDQRNKTILGVLLISLMVFSVAGYALIGALNGPTQTQQTSSYWTVQRSQSQLYLLNNPDQLSAVEVVVQSSAQDYTGQPVYVATESAIGRQHLINNLVPVFGRVQDACYGSCERDLPEKSCADLLIVYNETSVAENVRQQDNCFFVNGDTRALDAFLLAFVQ